MTRPTTPPAQAQFTARGRAIRPAASLLGVAALLAACGGGARKADDKRMDELAQQVRQLSQQMKAQDQRISALGTAAGATPLAASTESGPDNTVVAQCPPGAFLFRLPRTPSQGGEALCRPLAAPTAPQIKGR